MDLFASGGKVSVQVHDRSWAQSHGMNAFLAVAKGSQEAPLFLEVTYNNLAEMDKPIVIVGIFHFKIISIEFQSRFHHLK